MAAALLAAIGLVTPVESLAQAGRLFQLSTRAQVLAGDNVMIAGFIISGSAPKTVVVNVAGPSLASVIALPLRDPNLTLVRQSDGAILKTNDDWLLQAVPGDLPALVASGLQPSDGREPAVIATLAPGAYTAIVRGAGASTGVAVVGVYEVDRPDVPLINMSTRARVDSGENVVIAGFAVGPGDPRTVAVTIAGPSLVGLVPDPLQNPSLTLVRMSDGVVIGTNDNWQVQANPGDAAALQAAGLAPAHPLEPAIIATLAPGLYTAIASGVGTPNWGVAVVSVYQASRNVAITSAATTTFTVGAAGTFTVTTEGSPAATSVNAVGPLPAGVTFTPGTTTGTFSGTPAAGTGGTYPLTITAGNASSPPANQNFTLVVNQPPAITSGNAASFNVGTAGTHTVVASGFPAPALSLAGALPNGVTFNPATGALSGTPAAGTAGSYPLTFTAANGVPPNATQNFTLTVTDNVSITSANAATFTVGAAGTFTVTTAGTPAATSVTATGALPAGVTFTAGTTTGTLSGTPAAGTGGTYTLTITASNGTPPNATQTFTLTVNQAPAITSANAASFAVGSAGTHTVVANGFPAATLSVTGALPSGVTFNPGTGVLSGTPAAGTAGTYPLTFSAANGTAPDASQAFTLTVTQGVAITSANTTTFTVLAPGTFTVTTSGVPAATSVTATGALPAGVTFTPGVTTGTLAGTPAAGTGGSYPITITAANGTPPNATQSFTLLVNQPPAITSANNTTFTAGAAGSFTVTSTGFPAPTYSVTGALPAGITLSPAGVLSGTPAAGTGGSYPVTITAANGVAPNATQNFTLTVNQAPAITSGNATTFTAGSAGTFTVTASGVPVPAFSTASPLPAGVTLVSNGDGTATLAGTPGAGSGGTYSLALVASNGVAPNFTQNFTLTVNQAPAITSANATAFQVGVAGTFSVQASGFPASTFTTGGPLPAGVTLAANGTLSGTPNAGTGGVYAFVITAANGTAPNGTQNFTLTVTNPPVAVNDSGYTTVHDTALPIAAPGVLGNDNRGIPLGNVSHFGGGSLGGLVTANAAGATVNFGTSGSLTVNADGSVAFTPDANLAGAFTFLYRVTNSDGTSDATVTITVTNALPVVDLNGAAAGIDFAATFNEGGGAVAIVDPALTVADSDDTHLTGATIQIGNLLDGVSEALSLTCPDAGPGCSGAIQLADLTITATALANTIEIAANAPLADYQALLRTLRYNNTSASPNATARDVTITVNDGIADNNPLAHAIVTIAGVNQAPVITAPATATAATNGTLPFAGNVSVADPDAGTNNVQVTLAATNGTVTLSGTGGLTVVGNGTASVTSTGPIASQNAALNGMTFTPTPAYSGAASLQVDVSDLGNTGAGGPLTDTHTVNITVDSRPSVTTTAPLNGATGVATTSTITVSFSEAVTFTASSFTLSCSVSGARPFTLSGSPSASVVITPNTALPAGETCTLTVVAANVTDALAQTMAANHVFSFGVNTLPSVTSTVPANGASGVALASNITVNFSEAVTAAGGSFTVSCTSSGAHAFALTGVAPTASYTLDPTVDFTAGETCTLTVVAAQVTDTSAQNMSANFVASFQVAQPPNITSGASATFAVGQAGTFTVTTTGNPTGSSMAISHTGGLPAGVTFTNNSDGTATLAGTPAAGTGGSYPITITANNGIAPNATQNFTLTVNQAPAITSAPSTTFETGQAGTFTVTTTGFPTNASMSITQTGALPAGVTFTNNNNGTATLAGTPIAGSGGAYPITITANNGVAPNAAQSFTLTVNQPPLVTSANSVTFTVGTPGSSFTFTASGFPAPAIGQTGTLPTGITFAAPTISGTPTQTGTFPLVVTASNGVLPAASQNFTLTVACPTITVTNLALPNGLYQTAYTSTDYNQSGSTGSSGTFGATGLPAGLSIDSSTGVISGTPTTTVSNGPVTVTYTDNFGCSGSFATTITIRPVATNDTYSNGVGNTQFVVGAAAPSTPHVFVSGNVKANDNGPATLAVTFGAPASGAVVEGATDGTFVYTPNASFAGPSDSFTYTLTDGNGVTNTATVTVNLSQLVWYVDNTYGGGNGAADGRSHRPFTTLNAADAPSAANSYIYVHAGSGNTTGNLAMDAGQELRGAGLAFALNGLSIASGTRPTLSGTVTLANDALVTGLNFSGASPAITAANLASFSLPIVIDQVDVTGGSSALSLANVSATGTGAITWSNSLIQNTTGAEIVVNGGNIPLTFAANTTINGNAQRLIDIQNRSGGAVSFAGSLADASPGTGIFLGNNGATTFTFSGGMTLNGAATTFTATNPSQAGSLAITGLNTIGATIAPTAAIALNVVNTTIAAADLNFRSISAGSAGSGPANGIVLNNTGTQGGLVVTGNAGTCTVATPTCTGGQIQRTTGDAILLTSTSNVALNYMNIHHNAGSGIRGTSVNGFVLDRMLITDNGDSAATDDSGIDIVGLFGTLAAGSNPTSITNSTIQNNFEFEVQVTNPGSSALDELVMSGNTIAANGLQLNHGNLVNFLSLGTGNMKLTVTSGSFTGNTDTSGGKIVTATGLQCDHSGTGGTMTCNISGATFTNNNVGPQASVAGNGQVVFDFAGNNIQGSRSHAVNVFADANSPFTKTIQGRIRNNTIGTANVTGSGSSVGFPIRVQNEGRIAATLAITNNTINESASFTGINVNHGVSTIAGSNATNVTITGNSVSNVDSGRAVLVQVVDLLSAANGGTVCADIQGNTFAGIAGQAGDGTMIRLRNGSPATTTSTFNLRQLQATAAASPTEVDDANGFNDPSKVSVANTITYNTGACTQPSN